MLGLCLTTGVGWATSCLARTYFEHYPYFLDPVYYSYQCARLHVLSASESALDLARQQWLENNRCPLRIVPLLLVAQQMLAHQLGHMATALPALFCFVSLLAWTVYRRTGQALYAVACAMLFCAMPGLYSPNFGIAANWLDLVAGLWVASSTLCLINYGQNYQSKWLAGFALMASFGVLSRYVAAVFAFIVCAPHLIAYSVERFRREKNLLRAVIAPCLVIASVISLTCGYFLIAHFRDNAYFYSKQGYCLFQPLAHCLISNIVVVNEFFKERAWTVLLLALCVNLSVFLRQKTNNIWPLAGSLWLAISTLFFIVVVLRANGGSHTMYAVPLIFFAMVCPLPLSLPAPLVGTNSAATDGSASAAADGSASAATDAPRLSSWQSKFLAIPKARMVMAATSVILIVSSAYMSIRAFRGFHRFAENPPALAIESKALDVKLAANLASIERPVVWNAFFDAYSWVPSIETFYRFGKLPLAAGEPFFTVSRSSWVTTYRNQTPEQVAKRIYRATSQWVDVAVVFADPGKALEAKRFDNEYSAIVARYMAEEIPKGANWKRMFEVDTKRYGKLVGYRNTASPKASYEFVLHGCPQIMPYY